MRAMTARTCILLLCLLAGAAGAQAASWANIGYRVDAATAFLDVHAPEGATALPVLIWLHTSDSDANVPQLSEPQVAQITAAGQVLVRVELASSATRYDVQMRRAAAAVAFVHRSIARFGGDPAHVRVMGAGLGAQWAALLAVDRRWLAAEGLGPAILDGAILLRPDALDLEATLADPALRAQRSAQLAIWGEQPEDWKLASPLTHVQPGAAIPPMLLLAERDGVTALARQRERFTDRLREAGVANQVLLLGQDAAAPTGADFDTLGEVGRDAMFAWLGALSLPRLPRFEQLDFEADFVSGMRSQSNTLRGAETAFLLPFAGHLVATLSDADSASTEPAQLLIKRAPNADWAMLHAFGRGARFDLLESLKLRRDGSAQPLSVTADLLLVSLALPNGTASWQWAGGDLAFHSLSAAAPGLSAALVHRDAVTGADIVLLGSHGGGIVSATWNRQQAAPLLAAGAELEGADVAAFAIANGRAFAAVNGRNSGLYQRVDGKAPSWQRVAELDVAGGLGSALAAMSSIPDPGGAGHDVLLLAHARSGRIVRVDPMTGFGKTLELDITSGFAEVWGSAPSWVDFGGNHFVALQHPQTADQVLAIGLKIRHPQSQQNPHNGAWYLLRQNDGSYSYGLSYDFADPPVAPTSLRSVRAIAASPFVEDQGRAIYFGGFDAQSGDRDSAWIYRGKLAAATPRRGLWWDRDHRGHGLDLQPVAGRWMLTLATYDRDGEPVWYAALGQIVDQRFVAEKGALTRYRYALDRDPPQRRNAAQSGDVAIRFGVGADRGVCAADGVDRSDAVALAELSLSIEGRAVHWCIEPMQFAEAGVASTDANGLWYAGPGDTGWGISIIERGGEGRSVGVAYVYYYDAAGEPRWALGSAPVVDGNARYDLRAFHGYCAGCERSEVSSEPVGEFVQRLDGHCGEVSGTGELDIGISGKDQSRFVRSRFPLQRISTAACY